MRKRTLGTMTWSTLLLVAGMGFTPGLSAQAASMPAYEVLPALDTGVDNPAAVTVDSQGRVYVAETKNNRVRIFSQGGTLLGQIVNLAGAKSVAVDDAGTIYVGSQSQGSVTVFDASRNPAGKLAGEFLNPTDIDIHGGRIYVTDKGSGTQAGGVRVYDASHQSVGSIGAPGNGDGQLWHPVSLAIDPAASEMVIVDKKQMQDPTTKAMVDSARIQYFSMDGVYQRGYSKFGYNAAAGDLRMPVQVAVDAASRVYVTDAVLHKIMVYDNANTFLGAIADHSPGGMSMSATGRLYAASMYNQRVDVFGIENYSAMALEPATLNFTAMEGAAAPAAQEATVKNSGAADITWTAATADQWISVTSATGTLAAQASGAVPVEVAHDGLAAGTYQGSVQVTAPGMAETVIVNLTVTGTPLQVSPASLSFAAGEGATPAAQVLSISNGGSEPLTWSATADQAWLGLSKTAGTAPNTVKVYADTTGLGVGTHAGAITFVNQAGGKNVTVAVSLNIGSATAPPTDVPGLPLPGQGEVNAGGKSWKATKATDAPLQGVWASDTRNILAVGNGGTILSYNGRDWKTVSSGTDADLQSIWGSVTESGATIYAVGDGGVVLRANGAGWSSIAANTTEDLADVWGAGTDVLAAGGNGAILNLSQATSSTEDYALRSIWGGSATDVFTAGENGAVSHFDGNAWTPMVTGSTEWLNAIWGDPQTGEIFAVGEAGTIIHYNGTTWQTMDSGVSVTLHGVYGASASDLYAVGDSGVVLHYDGEAWSALLAGGVNLRDVWADDRLVVAVGDNGTVLQGMSSQRKKSRGTMAKDLLTPTLKGPETR